MSFAAHCLPTSSPKPMGPHSCGRVTESSISRVSDRSPRQWRVGRQASDAASAVHREFDARDEGRLVAGQVHDCASDIIRFAEPSERNRGQKTLAILGCVRYAHEVTDHPGRADHGTKWRCPGSRPAPVQRPTISRRWQKSRSRNCSSHLSEPRLRFEPGWSTRPCIEEPVRSQEGKVQGPGQECGADVQTIRRWW